MQTQLKKFEYQHEPLLQNSSFSGTTARWSLYFDEMSDIIAPLINRIRSCLRPYTSSLLQLFKWQVLRI